MPLPVSIPTRFSFLKGEGYVGLHWPRTQMMGFLYILVLGGAPSLTWGDFFSCSYLSTEPYLDANRVVHHPLFPRWMVCLGFFILCCFQVTVKRLGSGQKANGFFGLSKQLLFRLECCLPVGTCVKPSYSLFLAYEVRRGEDFMGINAWK